PAAAKMARAAGFVREAGGGVRARVFTRMWLSLLSLWSWNAVPMLPPEQLLLPVWAPVSVYAFGCWARQTIVALQIVTALQPTTTVDFTIPELQTGEEREPHVLDRVLRFYERRPLPGARRQALEPAQPCAVPRPAARRSRT